MLEANHLAPNGVAVAEFKKQMLSWGYREGEGLHRPHYRDHPLAPDSMPIQFCLHRIRELQEPTDICFYHGPQELNLIAYVNDALHSDTFKTSGLRIPRLWFSIHQIQPPLVTKVNTFAEQLGLQVHHAVVNQFLPDTLPDSLVLEG